MESGVPGNFELQESSIAPVVVSVRKATRKHYARPLKDYEPIYGYKERNLKKFLRRGREAEPVDLPPFDSPAEMPAWWKRNMKQRCSERILQAAKDAASDGASPEEAPESVPAPVASPVPASDGEGLMGTGFAAMMARAVDAEQVAWKAWQETLKANPFNPADEEQRRRAYDLASDRARKVLKDRDVGLAGDDRWGRWDEIEELANEHVAILNQSLRGVSVRVATKLALPPEVFRRMDEAFQAELDRIFDSLDKIEWRRSLVDEEEREFQLQADQLKRVA